jgi:hypothetical protein
MKESFSVATSSQLLDMASTVLAVLAPLVDGRAKEKQQLIAATFPDSAALLQMMEQLQWQAIAAMETGHHHHGPSWRSPRLQQPLCLLPEGHPRCEQQWQQ